MENLNTVRKFLLQTLPEIKNGKCEVPKANAICAMANSIISISRLELDYWDNSEVELPFFQDEEPEDEIQKSLNEIEERKKIPVSFGK